MPAPTALAAVLVFASTVGALAHHPMGGATPQTLWHGFLSGLGHPVIGLDHLAFVIAMGLIAAPLRRGAVMPVAFLVAGAAGAGLHLERIGLPFAEAAIALSVMAIGALIVSQRPLPTAALAGLFALAGPFHGHALAESIVGAEPAPLAAYLAGLATVQSMIALAAMHVARRLATERPAFARAAVAIAGGAVAATGFAFLLPTLG
jgi:urease accessory protein